MRHSYETTFFLLLAFALAAFPPEAVWAQDVFKAPTSFLTDIRTFITGPGGVLLAGVVIAASASQFFIVLIVVAIFFGAFKIAEVLQKANK